MNTINKISLATVLGIFSMSAGVSSAADAPDISGTYKCSYHDPFSTPPDGTETIIFKKNGDTFKVSEIGSNSVIPYFLGKGIFNKDINNAFAYIYWQPKTPSSINVEFFTIKPDGSIDGVFAESNKDKSGTETCTKSSGS